MGISDFAIKLRIILAVCGWRETPGPIASTDFFSASVFQPFNANTEIVPSWVSAKGSVINSG